MRNIKLSCQIDIDEGLFGAHKRGVKPGWGSIGAQKLDNIK